MERLTYRDEKGAAVKEQAENKTEDVWNCIERLCKLEDMMEDGRIIELPCKVDDFHFEPGLAKVIPLVTGENMCKISFVGYFYINCRADEVEAKLEELEGG